MSIEPPLSLVNALHLVLLLAAMHGKNPLKNGSAIDSFRDMFSRVLALADF
jgi:hypothetical protein